MATHCTSRNLPASPNVIVLQALLCGIVLSADPCPFSIAVEARVLSEDAPHPTMAAETSAKRVLASGGLPVAISALPLTRIDPPVGKIPVVPTGAPNGIAAASLINSVPLYGGIGAKLPSFTATVEVGSSSPPQIQTLIIDIGSPTNWVTCSTCLDECASPRYDPDLSSTSRTNLSCSSCSPPSYECATGGCYSGCNIANECVFGVEYADGSQSSGPYYSDTVNLGGFQTAPTFSFGCAESQGGFFLGGVLNATGLLGFGPSALSAWAQLTRDSDVPPIFSMCLSRNPIFKSTLFLGGVPPIDNLALDFVPRLSNGNFAFWDSGPPTGFLINGVPVDSAAIDPSEFPEFAIDTGTPFTRFPQKLLDAIIATMTAVTGLRVFQSPNGNILYISVSEKLGFGQTAAYYFSFLPPISIVLKDGVTITALPRDYTVQPFFGSNEFDPNNQTQIVIQMSFLYDRGLTILGQAFFNNHLVVFDGTGIPGESGRIDFAPVDCNNLTAFISPAQVTLPPPPSTVPTPTPTGTPSPTTPSPTTPSPTTPAPTTPSPTTPAPTTPSPTTPAPTTLAPTPGATPGVFLVGGTCDPSSGFPNQCFNNDGSLYTCCVGPCVGEPGAVPTCTGGPATTPGPTSAATFAPTPSSTTSPSSIFPVGGICDASSALPNQCFNVNGDLFTCCPGACPDSSTALPACKTASSTPQPTANPPNLGGGAPPPSNPPSNCDPSSSLPNQCFTSDGTRFVCCPAGCPATPTREATCG